MTLILSGTDGLSDVDGSAATPAIRGTDANTGIFFPSADVIAFSEGGVESARFNSSGNLQTIGTISVGNATPSTSGAGITFPASQSASSDANTLDDYEEGSWTPNVFNNGSSSTWTVKFGRYTKVGNLVTCWFNCDGGNSGTAGGALILSGLPFADIGIGNWQALGFVTTAPAVAAEPIMIQTSGTSAQIWSNGTAQDTSQKTYVTGMFTFRS
jgi:hypothetical protein